MDVWGPALVNGQDRERYFLLVVDDYSCYTTVFPLCSKGEVPSVFLPWIRAVRLQLRERFRQDLPVLHLHSDRGGEFSSHLLQDFCRGEGILQSFTLPASPQQNGVTERRIGLVMDAPHFPWPFAVRYAAHQLNLWPRVSLPETSPTLRWMGKVGDASVFRVWGSCAFVRDTTADKLSSRAFPSVFLGFPPDAPGWQFYHPTTCHVLSSHDVMFDESVPFYRFFPYRTAPSPPPPPLPLFLAPGPPPVDPLPPQGPAPSGVSQVCPLPLAKPFEVTSNYTSGPPEGGDVAAEDTAAPRRSPRLETPPGFPPRPSSPPVQPVVVDSGAARGGAAGGAEPGGAEPEGTEPRGAKPTGVELGGAEPEGAESGGAEPRGAEPEGPGSGGAEPRGAASAGGPTGASPQRSSQREPLSPRQLREWFARRTFGVALLGLEALPLEALALEALTLWTLELEALELEALELEALELGALALEVLEVLELEVLALEVLELEVLELEVLELEVLEVLELEVLELEVLALLVLEVLELEELLGLWVMRRSIRFSYRRRSRPYCHLT
ncbi:unnamed protein product [Closterium sp. Yama58-4]|nr:unnamed protein product [Closterium sp. Yama58-4]